MTVLTDSGANELNLACAWRSKFDADRDQVPADEYTNVTFDETLALICQYLGESTVRDAIYLPRPNSNDHNAQHHLLMKRRFDTALLLDALSQCQEMAEGTPDWSGGRADRGHVGSTKTRRGGESACFGEVSDVLLRIFTGLLLPWVRPCGSAHMCIMYSQ